MFILAPNKSTAQSRADALTLVHLKEVWGFEYDGQTAWPDGVTTRAVDVIELTDGRADFPVDSRHERHYTASERENQRDRIDDLRPEITGNRR